MRRLSLIVLLLAGICVMSISQHAFAQNITCTASNTTINFGPYPVLSGTVLDGVGSFTVTCVNGTASSATVTYTAKLPGSTLPQLAPPSGTDRLSYALYVDSARTQIWGDGTGGTFTISGAMTIAANSTLTGTAINFYGRISPGGQDVSAVSPGPSPTTYSQTLTVTVTCTGSTAC
jgi:spore coat protein U domain-containing protein, fimbrial subunit CupE1/2/3/6